MAPLRLTPWFPPSEQAPSKGAPLPERAEDDDEVAELIDDVPAAVVCALCGQADCPGCEPASVHHTTLSGVVVFVPWERPGPGLWSRLWLTTRASTHSAPLFFSNLSYGPVAPALSFGLITEGLAVGSTVGLWGVLGLLFAYSCAPGYTAHLVRDPLARALLLRLATLAWVVFTAVLLLAHTLHGLTLHRGARREGARAPLALALRFGFYSTGWDLATSPLGAVWLLCTQGRGAFQELLDHARYTPGRATTALLRGVYKLEEASQIHVRRRSLTLTMVAAVLMVVVALGVISFAGLV